VVPLFSAANQPSAAITGNVIVDPLDQHLHEQPHVAGVPLSK
jgi:hypothetical protein